MYYKNRLTQNQIAEDLAISLPCEQLLARRLGERFGLSSALVVPQSEDIDCTDNISAALRL